MAGRQDAALFVQVHLGMHLAADAYARHPAKLGGVLALQVLTGRNEAPPPLLWILFCVARLRREDGILVIGRIEKLAALREQGDL